jgi:uncharacterized protein YprB with RNaseH-like and TPR domain
VDLGSRLRAIVHGPAAGKPQPIPVTGRRELTYEPDDGYRREAAIDLARVEEMLGARVVTTTFGQCLTIDRRYESDRWHGDVQIGECTIDAAGDLRLLDPSLDSPDARKHVFIDLETTGLSGGAGTVAFLVGCGYFDMGAFQVRQFLLTSYAAERALLAAVADFFSHADLIVTYNGKTFDVPVMETRWMFHRMRLPLDGVPHFDMLHPARRLWRARGADAADAADAGCRLATLERTLMNVRRVGDVSGMEIPGRFFQFLRSGDPRPLEPVLEHNRLDLVSLAAVTARALKLAREGGDACRDEAEALALGRVFERAGIMDRAEACYRRASAADCVETRGEALYRLGLRCRRDRRFDEATQIWDELIALTERRGARRKPLRSMLRELRKFAVEALAIHHEHRARDLDTARELTLFALTDELPGSQADGMRHRLARLDRKIARKKNAQLELGV